MTNDLVKRLLAVALRQRAQLDSIQKANRNHFPMMRGLQRRVAELEAERDRNAEYVDLVSQYRAERDAAKADNTRLLKIIDAIVDEYDGQMHGPILHTINDARAALNTGKETK
jgi:hypothetical protein